MNGREFEVSPRKVTLIGMSAVAAGALGIGGRMNFASVEIRLKGLRACPPKLIVSALPKGEPKPDPVSVMVVAPEVGAVVSIWISESTGAAWHKEERPSVSRTARQESAEGRVMAGRGGGLRRSEEFRLSEN